ncbi:heat shock protein 60, mitochondrial [Batrachochytrium salamandrivorans]|nr:heat shock protein 60, mitochondrial [Batrachochytrium salamandrivorans]
MDLRKGIQAAVDLVVRFLKENARPITTSQEIAQVATISANGNKHIGQVIANVMEKVGKEGVITVQEGKTLVDELEITKVLMAMPLSRIEYQSCEHGDPKQLLKFINPKEAQYVEDGVGAHIRFRLGGHTFPPVIYYKVFVHQSIIDMNAFSPRNYTEEKTKQLLPRQRFNKAYTLTAPCESDTWYHRFENNEWRPVSETTWGNNCMHLHSVIIASPVKRPFHHVKTVRHQDILRRRKERDLNDEVDIDRIVNELDCEHPDFLIKWTRALDFESYQENWTMLATTQARRKRGKMRGIP